MTTKRFKTEVLADYSEFYLMDARLHPDLPEDAGTSPLELTLKDGLIAVGIPSRYFHFFPTGHFEIPRVPLIVDVYQNEPETHSEGWAQVVETSIALHSGELIIAEPVCKISLAPGLYRARIYWGSLHDPEAAFELSEEQLDAIIGTESDHYRVDLWGDQMTETKVLKRWARTTSRASS